jgi:hypothetical protein
MNFGKNLVHYTKYGLQCDLELEFATVFLFCRKFLLCNGQEVETGKIPERRSQVYSFLFVTYSQGIGRYRHPDEGTVCSNS